MHRTLFEEIRGVWYLYKSQCSRETFTFPKRIYNNKESFTFLLSRLKSIAGLFVLFPSESEFLMPCFLSLLGVPHNFSIVHDWLGKRYHAFLHYPCFHSTSKLVWYSDSMASSHIKRFTVGGDSHGRLSQSGNDQW